MSLTGKPRVSSVAISELKPVSALPSSSSYKPSWLKKANFVRVGGGLEQSGAAAGASPASSRQRKLQQVQQQQLKEKKPRGFKQTILAWTRFKPVNEFYVTDVPQKTAEKRGVKEARVWDEVRGLIEKRAAREMEKGKK